MRAFIDIGDLCPGGGQDAIVHLMANYDDLKSQLETRAAEGTPIAGAQLLAPLPRPNKVFCMGGNYREFGTREPSPMWGFFKSTDSILGPGGAVVLPDIDANIFHHEAELVLIFGKGGKDIPASEGMNYVFGYTAGCGRFGANVGNRRRPCAKYTAHLGAQVAPHLLPPWSLLSNQGRNRGPGEVAGHPERRRRAAGQLQHRRPRPLDRRID